MKWFNSRYAYPLIILSLVVSIALQTVWLHQLFVSQKTQLQKDIEETVSSAGIHSIYQSITKNRNLDSLNENGRFKEFFLSAQWLQMRQAFDNIRINGIHSSFHYGFSNDSSSIDMRILFNNKNIKKESSVNFRWNKEPEDELNRMDQADIRKMDAAVRRRLLTLGVKRQIYYALYDYGKDTLASMTLPKSLYRQAAYRTESYSYNLKSLHKYQAVIAELNTVVWYKMRYYLLSSLLMVALTGISFYFLLQLIRNQRLYADAKNAFTSNMTHEFKTPVSTVSVALESIIKYDLITEPEKLYNYLNISRGELQRLNLMIEKVLNLNELEHGQQDLSKTAYDLQKGLQEVIESLQLQLDHHQAKVHFESSPFPCTVNGNAAHLVNVWYNLLDNAIKYTQKGVNINVSCTRSANEVIIKIGDDGPGIASQYHDKIFERFFRVAHTDIHNVKGSGLGLHYVKEIMQKHHGKINLKSEPGKGSIFILTFPAL